MHAGHRPTMSKWWVCPNARRATGRQTGTPTGTTYYSLPTMTNAASPTGQEIATRAQEMKVLVLALNVGIISVLHPDLPLMQTPLTTIAGLPPNSDFPVHVMNNGDKQRGRAPLKFSAREILTYASQLRSDDYIDGLLSIGMINSAVRVGDMIDQGGHRNKQEPLIEFARHYRNACAHGDRWSFRQGEPKHPASCRGVGVTAALQGQKATWTTVGPRLHVEYLDDITNYFAPGTALRLQWQSP